MIIVYAAVLLGILIFVHEFGHFLFAKLLGVKVLKFSLKKIFVNGFRGFGAVGYSWGRREKEESRPDGLPPLSRWNIMLVGLLKSGVSE